MKGARFKSKEEFEWKYRRRMRRESYKGGELVLVRNSKQEMRLNRTTKPRYLGPYEVCRRTKGGSYVIKELDGSILKQGITAFCLLPYVSQHDKLLLKQIAKEVADRSEKSELEDDWYSSSLGDEFDDEED